MILGKATFIAALIIQIVIRYPYREGAKRGRRDRQERLLLILLAIGGLMIPLVYIFTDWLAFADYDASLWVIVAGVVVMAGGMWLFWRSHTDLGRNWSDSLEIRDDHTLITQGVYRRIRHPMYSASWLMYAANALLLSNWIAGFSGIVTFAIMYAVRVPKEEQMMLAAFGEQYQRYMAKTGRIFPKGGFTL